MTVIPPLAQGIVAGKESRAAKPKRKPIPDTMERVHLPARELSLEQRTLADGRVLVPVGEETNERIHFIEPKFVAEVEHVIVYGLPNAADGSLSNTPTITAPPAGFIGSRSATDTASGGGRGLDQRQKTPLKISLFGWIRLVFW